VKSQEVFLPGQGSRVASAISSSRQLFAPFEGAPAGRGRAPKIGSKGRRRPRKKRQNAPESATPREARRDPQVLFQHQLAVDEVAFSADGASPGRHRPSNGAEPGRQRNVMNGDILMPVGAGFRPIATVRSYPGFRLKDSNKRGAPAISPVCGPLYGGESSSTLS
jgi:hypothetical protein